MKTKLYLQGCLSIDGSIIHTSLSSSVIIFMLRYCQTNQLEVVFVADKNSTNCCSLKLKNLEGLLLHFSNWTDLPICVQNVQLPSIHHPQLSLVRSGLCVLLRNIIKESDKACPELKLIDILGFREGSMKMCAEVSGWTKLCEVDLPNSILLMINTVRDSKDSQQQQLLLPCDLMKLETHFHKKCHVHNDNKVRRGELDRVKKSLLCCMKKGLNLNQLESEVYANDEVKDVHLETNRTNHLLSDGQTDSHANNGTSFHHPSKVTIKSTANNSCLCIEQVVHLAHGTRQVRLNKQLPNKSSNAIQGGREISENVKGHNGHDTTDISQLLAALTLADIEYVHSYTEGIEMTLADLILFVYFYYLLLSFSSLTHQKSLVNILYFCPLLLLCKQSKGEAMNFSLSMLSLHIPNITAWMIHMSTLPTVVSASNQMGWQVKSVVMSKHPTDCTVDRFILTLDSIQNVDDEEMELSRCAKMKHKALNLEVLHLLEKFKNKNISPTRGDHPCGEDVHLNWSLLPPDVHPKEGDVPQSRMDRKCEQLENLATAVQALAKPSNILVDFCSGGGHLGILLAYILPDCHVFLVENKEESLLKACSRITSLGLKNITLYQCNLDYFIGHFDVGTSLHACGSATDMVVQLCLQAKASFVVCPCCYGSIQKTHLLSYPRSQLFLSHGVTYKEYLTLGHAADQTEQNITIEDRGHLCMDYIDTDRAENAKLRDYNVTLTSLKPVSCTPKSNLLIGIKFL